MNSELVASIMGYVLFAISEILPLINVPTNGFLHSVFLGLGNAFKTPEKDIELAQVLITTKPELCLASMVNTMSSNPVVQGIFKDLMNNPTNINNITAVQSQKEIASVVSVLRNNPTIKKMVSDLLSNPNIYNNINVLLTNPEISNPNFLSILSNPVIQNNPRLLDVFKTPDVIEQLLDNPQLSKIISVLSNDPDKLSKVNNIISSVINVN